MDEYYSVIQFLPEPLRTELKGMPPERAARVQEIRLRAGQAVQFTVGGAWQPAQQLLPAAQTALAIGPRMLRSCFAALCRDSAYAYEDELKQGYFTLPGGSRVGVAGVCARRALPILHLSISALRARCPVSCRPSFAARWMP